MEYPKHSVANAEDRKYGWSSYRTCFINLFQAGDNFNITGDFNTTDVFDTAKVLLVGLDYRSNLFNLNERCELNYLNKTGRNTD